MVSTDTLVYIPCCDVVMPQNPEWIPRLPGIVSARLGISGHPEPTYNAGSQLASLLSIMIIISIMDNERNYPRGNYHDFQRQLSVYGYNSGQISYDIK